MKKDNMNSKRINIIIIFAFSLFYVLYCNYRMIELPHLTWFDQIPLADKYYSGTLTWNDIFSKYGEHGLLANNLLYLLNVILFHGTTLFDVAINDINVIVCGVLFINLTIKTVNSEKIAYLCIFGESIYMFGTMQSSSGAMETQVRLGIMFFLIAMYVVDKELRETTSDISHLILTIFVIFISINVFGTLYSFAGVPLIWLIVILKYLKSQKINMRDIIISCTYAITIPFYIVEYHLFSGKGLSGLNGFNISMLNPYNFIKCLSAWCANGALGWAYHESAAYNSTTYLTIGFLILVIIVVGVVLYCKFKLYTKTLIPVMGIVYGFGVYVMVYLGRSSAYDWFANEWYNVHIKMMLASTIWIYGLILSIQHQHKISCIITCCICVCALLGTEGNICELKRVPYVRDYYSDKQKYLFITNPEDMPVDENGQTPLLHSLNVTMNSIEILRKYNLSVYQYWTAFEESSTFKATTDL